MNTKTRSLTTGMALLLIGLSLAMAVTLTAPQTARANPGVLYAAPALAQRPALSAQSLGIAPTGPAKGEIGTVPSSATGAVARYSFAQFAGTYTPITGGTVHGTGTIDDNNYNAVNIDFTFDYDGVAYTQVSINTNGFLRMGGTAFSGSCGYTPISSTDSTCVNLVSALGMDLQGNAGGELRSQTIGTAPNRVFVVQWKNFRYYDVSGDSFNFQIRLYETTNVVEIVYGAFTKNATSRSPQVGLKGADASNYNNRTGTDWAASARGATNSATMTLSQTSLPASGQTYQWTPSGSGALVLYAAPTAQGSGDCSSWADACTLQTALTNAFSGDEIWVKAGVHYPGTAGNRAATFTLIDGVALYGGFAGAETAREQRDWQANPTILSGDIDRNDINTDGNYIAETWNDIQGNNAYHVVTDSGADSTAVLDGFIITAGQANGNTGDDRGGGMDNSGNPTLTNITFSGNYADDFGGGMNSDFANPTLTDVTFSGNSAGYSGGGMENFGGSPTLMNVTFSGNSATYGGGMYNSGMYGGGDPTLTNVIFSNNSATQGGGMYNNLSAPKITNAIFYNNTASDGGGIYIRGSWPELINVTFSSNQATNLGGGVYNGAHPYYGVDSETTLANAILWGDAGGEIYNDSTSVITVTYSLVQGGWPGEGNLNADPLFLDPANGNLRLQDGSPAIDAGNDAAVPPGITTDLDGNPRFDYIVDMGAYEYQLGSGPRPFGKTSPLNGDAWQPLTLTLSWNPSVLASAYAYCYDTSNNDTCDTTWITTSQTSAQISGLSQGSTYYWQVRAVNNEGVRDANLGAWWSFITAPSRPGLFNKISPSTGSENVPLTVTLSWSASPGVEQYEYCYDTTDDNACATWLSAGTAISVTLSDLLPETTYYWQVRARNVYGITYANGGAADYWRFTTRPLRPALFGKTSPANGATGVPVIATLSWSESPGVEQYEYCYDTTNDNACSTWLSAGTAISVTLSDLLQDTTYYWQVRAINAYGATYADGSSTNYWSFTTYHLPGAFNKSSPANGSDQVQTVTLSWDASSDADTYEYCYDTTDDNACATWHSAGTNTSVTLSDLNPGATYYWQVRARNAGGVTYADGSSAAFWSFRVNAFQWSGSKVAFRTDFVRTRWWAFYVKVRLYDVCGWPVYDTVIFADGSGEIYNDRFSFQSSTYSFSGQFTSNTTAEGTYSLTNRGVNVPMWGGGGFCIVFVTESGPWTASRQILRPGVFGKTTPTHGAINQNTTLALGWNSSMDAAEYQYCLDTTDNNTCDTGWVNAGTNLGADLSGLAQNTTYYWQVRASNAIGTTEADDGGWWWFRTTDTTPPTVLSSVRLDPSPTSAESVRFRVTFSEDVTGVDAADFSLFTTGSLSGASVTGVIGDGAVYTVTVSTGAGSGTLRLDIPATATIADLAGNPLSGLPYTGGEAYTVSRGEQYYIFLPLVLRTVP